MAFHWLFESLTSTLATQSLAISLTSVVGLSTLLLAVVVIALAKHASSYRNTPGLRPTDPTIKLEQNLVLDILSKKAIMGGREPTKVQSDHSETFSSPARPSPRLPISSSTPLPVPCPHLTPESSSVKGRRGSTATSWSDENRRDDSNNPYPRNDLSSLLIGVGDQFADSGQEEVNQEWELVGHD